MKKAKITRINNRAKEYLPEPKEEVKIFSKEQVNLVNKLVKLNISKVTAQNLQTYSKIYFIRLLGKPHGHACGTFQNISRRYIYNEENNK